MLTSMWIVRSCWPAFGLGPWVRSIIKLTPVTVTLIRLSHGKRWESRITNGDSVGSCQSSGTCKMGLRQRKPAQPTGELVIQARREEHSRARAMLWTISICRRKEGFPLSQCVCCTAGVVRKGRHWDAVMSTCRQFWSLKNGYSDLVAISRVNLNLKPSTFITAE